MRTVGRRIKIGDRIVYQGRRWEIYRITTRNTERFPRGEPLYHLRATYPTGPKGKRKAWTYSACDVFSISQLESPT